MPKLPPDIFNDVAIGLLNNNRIHSINDFLQADFEKLVASKLSEEEILEVTHKFVSIYSAPQIDGLQLYKYLLKETNIIETHIKGVDELLNGGLITGTIIEICGLSSSGKTQLCLSMCINVAAKAQSNVTFIDTKRDFYSKRLLEILRHSNYTEDYDAILGRINVVLINNIYELITQLHFMKNTNCEGKKFGQLIILDSLSTLFFPLIGATSNKGLSLLNHIASLLKMIAVEKQSAIVLTNLASKYDENLDLVKFDDKCKTNEADYDVKPTLGKYWMHVPNTRIIISRINNISSDRLLIVRKSDYIKIGNTSTINIFSGGIV